ncbi:myb/SANT-like DNA-binding domain-containing protein 3 [Osmia bicornis bicornis]|uniref:myb/SANT-like DNA-binding domain-containing protein 3 n=1 Tax=Osmia bicornis bicornis TaxID=1437191 RepID=UPI001EAF5944|nr:myb/SANT-like DNA-binding domain-containing protein 3 [Osmia bicornis bicornis]
MTSKKHFTEIDKNTFVAILKNFAHIVEYKKSDSSSLRNKEEAWQEITQQYNMSAVISCKRNTVQLKKMWSNMKAAQRSAIMRERQSRMATGGGSAEPAAEINPEIAEIVPSLMQNAPSILSSNNTEEELANRREAIFRGVYILDDVEVDDNPICIDTSQGSTNVTPEATDEGREEENCYRSLQSRNVEIDQIVDSALQRKPQKAGTSTAPKTDYDERRLKFERIRRTMKSEEELADLKLRHEQRKNELEIEFLKTKYDFEIRAVAAAAEKAEFELQERKGKKH